MSRIGQLPGQAAPVSQPVAGDQREVGTHVPANRVGRQPIGGALAALSQAPRRPGADSSRTNEPQPAGHSGFASAAPANQAPRTRPGGLGAARNMLAATAHKARQVAQALNPMRASNKLNLGDQRHLLALVQRGDLAHTLFGNKPAFITATTDSANFLHDLTAGRELDPNFAIVIAPASGHSRPCDTAMVFNKNAVRKTMDQHPEVFGLPPAPSAAEIEAKLAALCTPEGASEALLRANEATLGTLLGFGAENAKKFAEPESSWADRYDSVYSTMRNAQALHREMDGLVRPFGARLWNSDETTQIANEIVNTTFDINDRIDALHTEALQTNRRASKESALIHMVLDTLFVQAPSVRRGLNSHS